MRAMRATKECVGFYVFPGWGKTPCCQREMSVWSLYCICSYTCANHKHQEEEEVNGKGVSTAEASNDWTILLFIPGAPGGMKQGHQQCHLRQRTLCQRITTYREGISPLKAT